MSQSKPNNNPKKDQQKQVNQARAENNTHKKDGGFQQLGSLFDSYQLEDSGGYITREFQDFGYRLAVELDDLEHKSLYIKMAKEVDRSILEAARTFVIDADHARSKARLFMWKVKQLQKGGKSS